MDIVITGIIEAKDLDAVDMLSLFWGAVIDLCCGLYNAPFIMGYTR